MGYYLEPAAEALAKPIIRRLRRVMHEQAVDGNMQDRFNYARDRVMMKYHSELICHGRTSWMPDEIQRRILVIFNRLERFVNVRPENAA